MKLENQVVSLPIAKKLKELGVKQESLFYWAHGAKIWKIEPKSDLQEFIQPYGDNEAPWTWLEEALDRRDAYSAFTCSELGEMLPYYSRTRKYKDGGFKGMFVGKDFLKVHIVGDTEADARGKMLIYLLEQGLIKLEK